MTLEYAYTNTKRCKLMNLESIYSVHYVRHFDIFPRGPPDTCISYILIRNFASMIWHILFALKALLTTQVKSTGTTDMHGLWESHVLSQFVKPKVRPFLSSGLSCLTTVKIVDNKLDYNSCHFKHISTYMLCFIYLATKFLLWTSWPWSAVPWLQLVQWSYHQR